MEGAVRESKRAFPAGDQGVPDHAGVTWNAFTEGVHAEGCRDAFAALSGDGALARNEVRELYSRLGINFTEKDIRAVMGYLTGDHNASCVTSAEYSNALSSGVCHDAGQRYFRCAYSSCASPEDGRMSSDRLLRALHAVGDTTSSTDAREMARIAPCEADFVRILSSGLVELDAEERAEELDPRVRSQSCPPPPPNPPPKSEDVVHVQVVAMAAETTTYVPTPPSSDDSASEEAG
jgi:Ca2+-binding EF-hand superfamily protein